MGLMESRKFTQRLAMVASGPQPAADLVGRLCAEVGNRAEGFAELERAIAGVADDQKRHALASSLFRFLDCQRMWLDGEPLPPPGASVFTACVPFTVENLTPLTAAQPLNVLTGPIDSAFAAGPRDELFPQHKNFVLAVPLAEMGLLDHWVLSFILANSGRDTDADRAYHNVWARFLAGASVPEQAVFAFVFSVTVPGLPTSRVSLASDTPLPLTPWAAYATDVLLTHAAKLNSAYPGFGMQLRAMTTLSQAAAMAADLRVPALMRRQLLAAPAPPPIAMNAGALVGLGDEGREALSDARQASSRQCIQYDSATLGLLTVPTKDGASEFLQAALHRSEGALAASFVLKVPLGTTHARLQAWWQVVDPQRDASVTHLPTAPLVGEDIAFRCIRDVQGRWVDRDVRSWGADAAEVYRTARWQPIGVEPASPDAGNRIPLPQRVSTKDLRQAIEARLQPTFVAALSRRISVPGLSYRDAFRQLAASFPALEVVNVLAPEASFLPSGMWAALRFESAKGVLFEVHESVQSQMALTDVDARFPLLLLHSPFPDVYLHLARPHEPAHDESNEGVFEGAFVAERVLSDTEAQVGGVPVGTRVVNITLVTYDDGEELRSLAFPSLEFVITPDDETDLVEHLRSAAAGYLKAQQERVDEVRRLAEQHIIAPLLEVCKILLYVNLSEARLTRDLRRSDLLARSQEVSGREKQKLIERAAGATDRIVVGPIESVETVVDAGTAGGQVVRPHLRRGYVRAQPYGPGQKLRKPVWIRPLVVNQHLLTAGEVLTAKKYEAR